ncbi:hypothetical protein PS1_042376 [Malus domestica]
MIQARKTRGRTIAPGLLFRRGDGRCSFAYVQIQIVRPRKNEGGESMAAAALRRGSMGCRISGATARPTRPQCTRSISSKPRRETTTRSEVGERIGDGA